MVAELNMIMYLTWYFSYKTFCVNGIIKWWINW